MSRELSTTNEAQVNASHVHDVVLVHLDFDTPVYVHSGIGTISYGGNSYLGVGGFGSINNARESEALGPASITLTLSGVDSDYISEALDSGNLYDAVTIYEGYRQDDGTLVDDPWIVWKGWFEHASISVGEQSVVGITCQHDLADLNEKNGGRYSDEDQQDKFSGDVGFEFTSDMATVKLLWGGLVIGGPQGGAIIGGNENTNQP